jgi:outer membrane lipase/esterase
MRKQFVLAVLAVSLASASGSASAYTTLFAFGDSLSDAGNAFIGSHHLVPAPPYFGGHFSNGPTWVEDLSLKLGLGPLEPSLARGTDFAVGGATAGGGGPIDLTAQVKAFQSSAAGLNPKTIDGALFTLDIGPNDIFGALSNPKTAAAVVTAAANSAADEVKDLHADGARSLLLYEVPNLGLIPDLIAQGPAAQFAASSLAQLFNATVLGILAPLETGGDPLKLFELNMYDNLTQIVTSPNHGGFTDVTDPCWTGNFEGTGGTVCSPTSDGQNKFLFWDGVHPTAAGHLLTADLAYALVAPEPSTWAMMLIGFGGLGLAGYRARRAAGERARS